MYHDIIHGGMYVWVVEDMHKRYGGTPSQPAGLNIT